MENDIFCISFILWRITVSPYDVENITGVIPYSAKLKGERNQELIVPKENIWTLKSYDIQSNEISDHWEYLENIILPAKKQFKEIIKTGEAKLVIVINNHLRIPPIFIPPSMCEFSGYVNATIEIDHMQ